MRGVILMGFLLLSSALQAQHAGKENKTVPGGKIGRPVLQGSLQHRGSYQAHGQRLQIADPTINALNRQGYGNNTRLFGSDGILGLPKGTYGYGRGQLWLRSTDATSIGGTTGNSAVGTGSTSGGVGMSGSALGVNGKSPYAGPAIWGSAQGLNLPDSTLRSRAVPGRRD